MPVIVGPERSAARIFKPGVELMMWNVNFFTVIVRDLLLLISSTDEIKVGPRTGLLLLGKVVRLMRIVLPLLLSGRQSGILLTVSGHGLSHDRCVAIELELLRAGPLGKASAKLRLRGVR